MNTYYYPDNPFYQLLILAIIKLRIKDDLNTIFDDTAKEILGIESIDELSWFQSKIHIFEKNDLLELEIFENSVSFQSVKTTVTREAYTLESTTLMPQKTERLKKVPKLFNMISYRFFNTDENDNIDLINEDLLKENVTKVVNEAKNRMAFYNHVPKIIIDEMRSFIKQFLNKLIKYIPLENSIENFEDYSLISLLGTVANGEIINAIVKNKKPALELQTELLSCAIKSENIEIIEWLYRKNKNILIMGSSFWLHFAVKKNKLAFVNKLLALGENPNRKDDHGNTPLHMVTKETSPEIIKSLILFGAKPYILNDMGETSLTEIPKEIYLEMSSKISQSEMGKLKKAKRIEHAKKAGKVFVIVCSTLVCLVCLGLAASAFALTLILPPTSTIGFWGILMGICAVSLSYSSAKILRRSLSQPVKDAFNNRLKNLEASNDAEESLIHHQTNQPTINTSVDETQPLLQNQRGINYSSLISKINTYPANGQTFENDESVPEIPLTKKIFEKKESQEVLSEEDAEESFKEEGTWRL